MSTTVLYTPEVLGLTIRLAHYPWSEALPLQGEARSQSCGSTIALGLSLGERGTVESIGIRSQACAIGQAAAAIFADAVIGRGPEEVCVTGETMARWLSGEGPMPEWPGLAKIAAARDYPGRHGAVLLPWRAAIQAFSKDE
nr:iron-sulfur cluster assembly scaffold protein [uncultured Novosphingobium sp.]